MMIINPETRAWFPGKTDAEIEYILTHITTGQNNVSIGEASPWYIKLFYCVRSWW